MKVAAMVVVAALVTLCVLFVAVGSVFASPDANVAVRAFADYDFDGILDAGEGFVETKMVVGFADGRCIEARSVNSSVVVTTPFNIVPPSAIQTCTYIQFANLEISPTQFQRRFDGPTSIPVTLTIAVPTSRLWLPLINRAWSGSPSQ